MKFDQRSSLEILERTPFVVEKMLQGISKKWHKQNEGTGTWSPYDVVGHYIHGEKTDWIPRMEIIQSDKKEKQFVPFDRFAQFRDSKGKTLEQLISEFKRLRKKNIQKLRSKKLRPVDLKKTAIHPAFGKVTLEQLLSTWVVHDLAHIAQIARVMSKQYSNEVGPWKKYLPILKK